ncbi:hypothetical protein Tco_0521888 [Tanacetum coccineum]
MENADLKGQIQEKVFVTIALQTELWKLKGKNMLDNAITITNATTFAPGMFKIDLDPLAPRLLKNRDAHIDYLKYTQEQADILLGIIEQAKSKQPLDNAEKLVAVIPMNKVKKVMVSEPLTSSSNIHKQVESSKTPDSNTHVLPSTGLKSSTSASRSQPTGNKNNDRISQTPSRNMKNKVEGSSATDVPSSSSLVNDRNCSLQTDQIAKIMGYGDYQLGNVIISRVYYVEGLGHNLFSVGKFCDSDLEVAF